MMYENVKDCGRNGRNFEVEMRNFILNKYERCHPLNATDISVKSGVTLECKTGCPWLVNPVYESKEDALEILNSGAWRMKRAMFVAYLPQYDGTNLENALIVTQKQFLSIFSDKIRVKQGSNKLWGIAIQSYIPTPTFKASVKKYEAIITGLFDNGEYVDLFMERMGL